MDPRVDRQSTGPRRAGAATSSGAPTRDLQTLLSDAVMRLRDLSGSASAVAWAAREAGEPYLVAAAYANDPPGAPDGPDFRAVSTLRRVTRLDRASGLLEI